MTINKKNRTMQQFINKKKSTFIIVHIKFSKYMSLQIYSLKLLTLLFLVNMLQDWDEMN